VTATSDEGHRRAAWAATVTAVVVVAAFIAGKAARDAILLSQFSIRHLPIFITIAALISLPTVLVAGKLMTRFGPARLMPALNVLSAAVALGEWLLLGTFPRAMAVAVYLHLGTAGALLVSGFWSMINERFDIQTAKRHIARIGIGATLGGILGGLIAQGTAVYLAPDAILLVLAGMQLACAATLYLLRGPEPPMAAAPAVPVTGTWFALGVVTRSRLLRNVGAVVVLGAVAAGVLDYVFKADLVAGASSASLLRSLAIYYTVTSVLTAVVQVAVCGPLVARLGVPRSIATLPIAVTAFGLVALAVPAVLAAIVARGAETITRSTIYRAGYELLYAPLSEADKRPSKLVLDVGAERIGDLIGAQFVGLLVFVLAAPRLGLLIGTVVIGVIALMFAVRLPRSYTQALEDSLVAQGTEPGVTAVAALHAWPAGGPTFGQAGELSPLPLRVLARAPRRPAVPPTPAQRDQLTATIVELRSQDPARIRRALAAGVPAEVAALVIGLVARDDVGREALDALRGIAPRCTGTLVDALLDPTRELIIRCRLPEALFAGEPNLAAWGLWRGLVDSSFEIRYRCGEILARLATDGRLAPVAAETVFDAVRRERMIDPAVWLARDVIDDRVAASAANGQERDDARVHSGSALAHVFTVLGLVLPSEPLRIALHAVLTDDPTLRETALEYLESILPTDVRAQLWPVLAAGSDHVPGVPAEGGPAPARTPRTQDELLAALNLAYPATQAQRLGKQQA
jgi:AAA family ATP:ADP antiporter